LSIEHVIPNLFLIFFAKIFVYQKIIAHIISLCTKVVGWYRNCIIVFHAKLITKYEKKKIYFSKIAIFANMSSPKAKSL